MRHKILAALTLGFIVGSTARASTFVIPNDTEMVRRADAIVEGEVVTSHSELTPDDRLQTITEIRVSSVLKGAVSIVRILRVVEPGGQVGERVMMIAGVPKFEDGEQCLLFLTRTPASEWAVTDLVLGRFEVRPGKLGRDLVVRSDDELKGPDADGTPHVERSRDAEKFLAFVRDAAEGRKRAPDYYIDDAPLPADTPRRPAKTGLARHADSLHVSALALYNARSYTMGSTDVANGFRWDRFPTAVPWVNANTEPGAPNGGVDAIVAGLGAWTNEPNSNVNYIYTGVDTVHTSGLQGGADGVNSVIFERDLTYAGAPAYSCGSGGTVALGGITTSSGTHPWDGSTFYTTIEGDVEGNKGLANCTSFLTSASFITALTHELGHTLGFRHSDQTRVDNYLVPCATDPTLECSSAAVMNSSAIPYGATLQPWDVHAVQALYGSTGGGTAPPAPSGVVARGNSSTQVTVTWSAVSGATSYLIFRRDAGVPFRQIGTSLTTSYVDTAVTANSAYLYLVRASNAGGTSGDSNTDLATTVVFTDDPLVPASTVIKAVHLTQLRTAVNAVRALAGLAAASFTDPNPAGVVIKAVHITELRTALNATGLVSTSYTNSVGPGVFVRAVDFQELRDRVK